MSFELISKDSHSFARTGRLTTLRGQVETPVFMPVATRGTIKHLTWSTLVDLGASIVLMNTYHLHLRPGEKLISEMSGAGKWSGCPLPILTDSGGYQAFSLGVTRANLSRISDDSVSFRSHYDGQPIVFTPEKVVDIQLDLGSEIMMVLDDCPPWPADFSRLKTAVDRSSDWAKRSYQHLRGKNDLKNKPLIFGIIQGGSDSELRLRSLRETQSINFDGVAIGGVSVGESKFEMIQVVKVVAPELDPERPRYLMGVGDPIDLIQMVYLGIDMFDCVLPTRLARHGSFWHGKDFQRSSLLLASFATDSRPLDPDCRCFTCINHSRSYLRHLLKVREGTAWQLMTIHNLSVVLGLMNEIRETIKDGSFASRFQKFLGEVETKKQ